MLALDWDLLPYVHRAQDVSQRVETTFFWTNKTTLKFGYNDREFSVMNSTLQSILTVFQSNQVCGFATVYAMDIKCWQLMDFIFVLKISATF